MDIKYYNISSTGRSVQKNQTKQRKEVSFGNNAPLYAVKNATFIKKFLPQMAYAASIATTVGYFVGSMGLFYDSYKENGDSVKAMFQKKPKIVKPAEQPVAKPGDKLIQMMGLKKIEATIEKTEEAGVKTITTSTKFGKIGMNFAKIGIAASSLAGIACGLGEGIPTMALGEATNVGAAPIIETPIGTGLFGIGIASIFSGLALENTPELKLNHYKLMAAESFSDKTKMIAKNMGGVGKEVLKAVGKLVANIYKPKFWKENLVHSTPKHIVFSESVNKDGLVTISRKLRHNRNYLMHAASFTLGLGGVGIIAASILRKNKAQKAALKAEEGGFLFDNIGMTRLGFDKLTAGHKSAGSSFAIGGIINAVSQFMGIDNKDGRAMQWLGIALVFVGFSIDRRGRLKKEMADAVKRTELTDVFREWKIDLSKIVDKNELKTLLKELKKGEPVTNIKFNNIESTLKETAEGTFKKGQEVGVIEAALEKYVGKLDKSKEKPFQIKDSAFEVKEISEFNEVTAVLKKCTKKIFGSENPIPEP